MIAAAASGVSFMLANAIEGGIDNPYLHQIQSPRFYDDNTKPAGENGNFHNRNVPYPSIIAPGQLALSDDGAWYAFADIDSGNAGSVPRVQVRATSNEDRKQNSVDFNSFLGEFASKWKLSRLSFDHQARNLVVGVVGSSSLFVFGLSPDPETKKKVPCDKPVLGWDHSVDGKIAIVTDAQGAN